MSVFFIYLLIFLHVALTSRSTEDIRLSILTFCLIALVVMSLSASCKDRGAGYGGDPGSAAKVQSDNSGAVSELYLPLESVYSHYFG